MRALFDILPETSELLWVAARPARGRRAVVEVAGEVDHFTAPLLSTCLRTQTGRTGLRELVVDLDGVTFLGGAGLAVLARARQECLTRGARLVVRHSGHGVVLRVLRLAGLAPAVRVRPRTCPPARNHLTWLSEVR